MKKLAKLIALSMFSLVFSSCFFSLTDGEFNVVYISDPNPAWVSIEIPTGESTYITTDNAIYLSGSAFVSDEYFQGPPWDTGVAVSWNNSRTGDNGTCIYYTEVLFPFFETKWYVLIPLYYGDNLISITAYEYLAPTPGGYSKSSAITVTRI